MVTVIITLAVFCLVLGFMGSIIPALPGPPLSYLALVLLQFCLETSPFSMWFLVIVGIITAIVIAIRTAASTTATATTTTATNGTRSNDAATAIPQPATSPV